VDSKKVILSSDKARGTTMTTSIRSSLSKVMINSSSSLLSTSTRDLIIKRKITMPKEINSNISLDLLEDGVQVEVEEEAPTRIMMLNLNTK
jgi:hypothetical protein